MKLDVLAIGAHPDDVELSCSGTIAKLVKQGRAVGILDLTRGELGTRGTPAIRAKEAADAARVLGVRVRDNLKIPDGNIEINKKNLAQVIAVIRKYQPQILLIPYSSERHPDHEHAHRLAKEAWYYSGVAKIRTADRGKLQQRFRPDYYFEYMMLHSFPPSFIVDISDVYTTRVAAIKAFKSQFFSPESKEPRTFLSTEGFMDLLETRAKHFGQLVGASYGEPFFSIKPIGIHDLSSLLLVKG
jgi:bacillithiol biosynthesis deacetylase BshB1